AVISFLGARRDQPIAVPDARLLDGDPVLRFDQGTLRDPLVLDASQGVEGVEPRQAPLIAQTGGDPAGEPVVAVDQAVARPAAALLADDRLAKVGKEIEQA